jgi:hypothetical protein
MGYTAAPHSRSPRPAPAYRGSKTRVDGLSPFERPPADFWLFIAAAAIMLGITAAIIYNAL